jgi:hypothetical protein
VVVRCGDKNVLRIDARHLPANLAAKHAGEAQKIRAADCNSGAVILKYQGANRQFSELFARRSGWSDSTGYGQQGIGSNVAHGDSGAKLCQANVTLQQTDSD